jgi:hypothetical protein
MVQDFYLNIENNLSKDRLDNYGKMDNADRETVVARYLWNIAISQSLYQLLHFFEILLRNKINNAFECLLYFFSFFWGYNLTRIS